MTRSVLAALSLTLLAPGLARADADLLVARALGDDLPDDPAALVTGPNGLALAGASLHTWSLAGEPGPRRALAALDLAAAGDGLVLAGPAALVRLDELGDVAWTVELAADRVAAGLDGSVVALAGRELRSFDPDGRPRATWSVDADLAAVALDAAADLVLVAGHRVVTCDDEPRDVAVLRAFTRDGAPRWSAYEHGAAALCAAGRPLAAATRGVDVTVGADDHVYLLGEADGAENLFRADPNHLDARSTVVLHDGLTDPDEAQRGSIAYYARFDRAGQHLAGQFLGLPATDSEPSRLSPRAIVATADGMVVVAGATNRSFAGADERPGTEDLGQNVGFVLVVEPDFDGRHRFELLEDLTGEHAVVDLALTDEGVVGLVLGEAAGDDALVDFPLWDPQTTLKKKVTKHPDNDTQATFGFESGVSGSDPTCYCSDAPTGPATLLALGVLPLLFPRRRR